MGEYQGQPEYVVVGYLTDLFEPWVGIEGSELGEFLTRVQDTAQAALSISDEKRAAVLVEWIREDLQALFDDDWGGVLYTYDDWLPVYRAQDEFEKTTADWRKQAVTFKGEAALEECIAGLPEWIQPMPDRLPKPDKEREQYEKLKAKYGDA